MDRESLRNHSQEPVEIDEKMGNPMSAWDGYIPILVVGTGGQGCNATQYLYDTKPALTDFVILNTDSQDLYKPSRTVPNKIQIGKVMLDGNGAGTTYENGRDAMLESMDEFTAFLDEGMHRPRPYKVVFILAGLGGGTGSGSAPLIAKECRERGLFTVVISTLPSNAPQGTIINGIATDALRDLTPTTDAIVLVDNSQIYREAKDPMPMKEAFAWADSVIAKVVAGFVRIISSAQERNSDLNDLLSIFRKNPRLQSEDDRRGQLCVMTIGMGSGEKCVSEAINSALDSPLLFKHSIEGAMQVLVNYAHGPEVVWDTKREKEVFNTVTRLTKARTDVKYGGGIVDWLEGDQLQLIVIAGRFEPEITAEQAWQLYQPILEMEFQEILAQPLEGYEALQKPDLFALGAKMLEEEKRKNQGAPAPGHADKLPAPRSAPAQESPVPSAEEPKEEMPLAPQPSTSDVLERVREQVKTEKSSTRREVPPAKKAQERAKIAASASGITATEGHTPNIFTQLEQEDAPIPVRLTPGTEITFSDDASDQESDWKSVIREFSSPKEGEDGNQA